MDDIVYNHNKICVIILRWQVGNKIQCGKYRDMRHNDYIIEIDDGSLIEIPVKCCRIDNIYFEDSLGGIEPLFGLDWSN